jgi:hypothetical protein
MFLIPYPFTKPDEHFLSAPRNYLPYNLLAASSYAWRSPRLSTYEDAKYCGVTENISIPVGPNVDG